MKIQSHSVMKSLVVSILLWSTIADARALPDFTQIVKQHGAAVVNISTRHDVASGTPTLPHGLEIPELPDDAPFGELFKYFFRGEPGQIPRGHKDVTSLGSGFIISEDGFIITNYHVVADADEVLVRLTDQREFVAELIGSDKRSDIALLKISADHLPVLKLGSAKDLEVGEWVLAIGSPFNFDNSVTAGIVSAKRRSLPSGNYIPFIQTDVAINPGNSGGPLFNLDGEVVGVNAQIFSKRGGYMGLSFAIPIDLANDVVQQLKQQGHVTRGWLGVLIQNVTRELAKSFGMQQPQGALVAEVISGSPAEQAGIEVGDIIIQYNDKVIHNSALLPPMVGITPVATNIQLKVLRNGKEQTVTVKIGVLPEEDEPVIGQIKPAIKKENRLGITVSDLTKEQREQLNIKQTNGVIVGKVNPDSIAGKAGIRAGDVILHINNNKIKDANEFHASIKEIPAGKFVRILIHRRGSPIFLAIKFDK